MRGTAPGKKSTALLFLGMYPLERLDSAGPVRIFNLHQAVEAVVPTVLIAGTRARRRWQVVKYVLAGKLRRTSAVYVESNTSYATEIELVLLLLCKLLGIPVAIYIRDAHQDFPQIFDRSPIKVRILDWLWRGTVQVYVMVADVLLFPTEGLARHFNFSNTYRLLPPGGQPGLCIEDVDSSHRQALYVGASSDPSGVDMLLDAMRRVTERYPDARCILVTDEKSSRNLKAAWGDRSYVHLLTSSFDDLPALMRRTRLTVIPRRSNPYNDFALPVKLFDYMSFGKPVVVTNCSEQARYVRACNSGLVVEDTPEGIAEGILMLLDDPNLAKRLGANGYRAVQDRHSWGHRARELLSILDELAPGRIDITRVGASRRKHG